MAGAPSQLDLFDHKPALTKHDGQDIPEEFIKGERFAFIKGTPKLLGSPFQFKRHGQSGAEISELLPHTAREVADEIAIVRSMQTDAVQPRAGADLHEHRHPLIGRPSMGSWLSYGLGSENRTCRRSSCCCRARTIRSGGKTVLGQRLPADRSPGRRVPLQRRAGAVPVQPAGRRRAAARGVDRRDQRPEPPARADVGDPEIQTRIAAYEMAYRMQTSVPGADGHLRSEPASIHELLRRRAGPASFANNCLLARRLVERGVRFVQLYPPRLGHARRPFGEDIVEKLPHLCRQTDRPIAALLNDLKQRGLLDDTLVVWGGEFGRTPMNEARNGSKFLGRDHHPRAFTMWLAGGGIKPASPSAAPTSSATTSSRTRSTSTKEVGLEGMGKEKGN